MSVLSHHGWKSSVSERRGFTAVQANRESRPPVVVALDESVEALTLFRSALDEAMNRGIRLVVLDCGEVSLHDQLWGSDLESPEHRILKGLWTNPHVSVVRMDIETDLEATISYCESNGATLLVLSADHLAGAATEKQFSPRLLGGGFDLLVVADR